MLLKYCNVITLPYLHDIMNNKISETYYAADPLTNFKTLISDSGRDGLHSFPKCGPS